MSLVVRFAHEILKSKHEVCILITREPGSDLGYFLECFDGLYAETVGTDANDRAVFGMQDMVAISYKLTVFDNLVKKKLESYGSQVEQDANVVVSLIYR